MKKVCLSLLVVLTTISFSVAQQNGKTKNKNKENRESNYNEGWGGKKISGEGDVVKESRDAKDFTGVISTIGADIFLKQGSSFKVTVEGQKNILDLLKTEVKNGALKITFEKGYSLHYRQPLKVYVEAPSFAMLGMSGSGNVVSENTLSGEKLDIEISGSGDFDLSDIQFKSIDFEVSGSGDVKIGGSTESIKLEISGSGNIKANDLKTQKALCRVSGSGDITVNVKQVLEAYVSGSGDIKYSGSPASVKTKVTGSGDIEAF
jgi:Putative auto-transporter adhesin, head GIN domain